MEVDSNKALQAEQNKSSDPHGVLSLMSCECVCESLRPWRSRPEDLSGSADGQELRHPLAIVLSDDRTSPSSSFDIL